MQVQSKFIENNSSSTQITSSQYFKEKIKLKTFKIPELKKIAKYNKLHVSGNKGTLISRIETYFIKCFFVLKIQAIARRYLVTKYLKYKGPALKNRSLCVNETDFYTLEPINEIPIEDFYSYKDEQGFIYGFQLDSLITMYIKQNKTNLMNPYNRTVIPTNQLNDIIRLNILTKHIFLIPANKSKKRTESISILFENNNEPLQNVITPSTTSINSHIRFDENSQPQQRENRIIPRTLPRTISRTVSRMHQPSHTTTQIDVEKQELFNKLSKIRNYAVDKRIQELFMEIDYLGNYTQSSWFSLLSRNSYLRFYCVLFTDWNNYETTPINIRRKISPYFNPFNYGVHYYSPNELSLKTLEELQKICLTIMENIIYSGKDIEDRKIGVFKCLAALTVVSLDARERMPWLYEYISYNSNLIF